MDMSSMDMGMDMDGGSDSSMSMTPLNTTGVDFTNSTQAADFLDDLLDDSILQVIGNQYARYFWYGVVVVIGLASVFNIFRLVALRTRLRQAAKGVEEPAKPNNVLMRWMATATAIGRESTYMQFTPVNHPFLFKIPPVGTILLVSAYLGFVLALEFVNNNVAGAQHLQALGVRAAWMTIAQVPLLILLVGKNNWIGLFTGVSYERLNVLHRWVSRVMLLLATFHLGFQARGWSEFPGIFELEWTTDSCVPTGLATYVILIWMNISTFAPIRNLCYEFFVIQHIITFFGFIIAVMWHLPSTALYSRVYIYIPIAFYVVDRIVRFAWYSYTNMRISRASLTSLDGGVTRIQLRNPRIKNWTPGAHILISFPVLGFGQNHPATIASTPKSHNGDIILMLKSQKGFTRRMLKYASESTASLLSQDGKSENIAAPQSRTYAALIDGPYGGTHADFAAFDSVVLIAGSTGITFILPILLDLAYRCEQTAGRLPVRRVHLVWCVKEFSHARWIQAELASAFAKLRAAGVDGQVSFYVTCADTFTSTTSMKECPCACDKSLGPCCCVNPEDVEMEKAILGPITGESETDMAAQEISEKAPSTGVDVKSDKGKGVAARVSRDYNDAENDNEIAIVSSRTSIGPASPRASAPPSLVNVEAMPQSGVTRADVYSGRPIARTIVAAMLDRAHGETGVAVCGPLGMSVDARNAVAGLSDERAVHKGTGAEGVYLHVEGFSS